MQKIMLGDNIYRLRKAKGLSQAELGELVGVSNKAVSKWETYEANPDISLLPLLAKSLEVTADELLTGIKPGESDTQQKETKVFGLSGAAVETPLKYEFVSDKKTKKGEPFLHINIGKGVSTINTKARGFVAIGNNAKGVISIGLFSMGLVSLGLLSVGLLSIGILAAGFASFGYLVFGAVAGGAIAFGVVAAGAIAIGVASFGGISVGFWAHTLEGGNAVGRNIIIR